MKKTIWLLPILLLGLMLILRKQPTPEDIVATEPAASTAAPVSKTEAIPKKSQLAETLQSPAVATPEPAPQETPRHEKALDWMDLLAQHQLTPKSLEDWARASGTSLNREVKGHVRSGERLEVSWGEEPTTTAVFDSLSGDQFQLSAVRTVYPQGTALPDLKKMLEYKFQRPVEREDARSVVYAADKNGLVIWAAQDEDGRLKVAFEYGAHSHAEEPKERL